MFIRRFTSAWRRRGACATLLGLAVTMAAGCGGNNGRIPTDVVEPDRYLFDQGQQELEEGHWLDARQYFGQIIDNYPGSARRAGAKLGIADSFFGEHSVESLVLAANEYTEFLRFYPTNQRADYAQYRLAMTYFEQMRAPERDQSDTRNALRELDRFLAGYPGSDLRPEGEAKWREARSRLSEAIYLVGRHNLRRGAYRGAWSRFEEILDEDPEYPQRDLVYFYLAETWDKSDTNNREVNRNNTMRAIDYLERLLAEFPESEKHEEAAERLERLQEELKTE